MLKLFKKISFWAFIAVSIAASTWAFLNLGWVQAVGWIYSISFALSALPEAVASLKKGKTDIADGTIGFWILGEITGLAYGIGLMQWPLIFNCGVNALLVGIILWYRLFPRKEKEVK